MKYFDGKKIRDKILADLGRQVLGLSPQPNLTVIWIGDDFASARYIEAKQRAAEKIGVHFDLIKYSDNAELDKIKARIQLLNQDPSVTGIMLQVPVPKNFGMGDIISEISPAKDIDGLRFCLGLNCNFTPPVIMSILEAIRDSNAELFSSVVAVIGRGFLVGGPTARILDGQVAQLRVADRDTPYLATITSDADIIISATGIAKLIKPNMIKKDVILIDAGTTELGGKLAGDIDPECFVKAAYYTPVPGGIGPVTVAMLMRNVVEAAEKQKF